MDLGHVLGISCLPRSPLCPSHPCSVLQEGELHRVYPQPPCHLSSSWVWPTGSITGDEKEGGRRVALENSFLYCLCCGMSQSVPQQRSLPFSGSLLSTTLPLWILVTLLFFPVRTGAAIARGYWHGLLYPCWFPYPAHTFIIFLKLTLNYPV